MNYIILNGKKSTMVKGLMIQSLPPITKPLIRTRREEIDGRDGDIVTKLGYSAYDRELSIGLFGDYDMSEVAQYFDSEGEAIFSNELDKKYNYQILDQIDYERLGKFKQAVIKFHVQPFKYPTVEDRVSFRYQTTYITYTRLFNHGNIISKPIYTLPCSTSADITYKFYNTTSVKTMALGLFIVLVKANKPVIVNTRTMQAYEKLTGRLVNRDVSGNFDVLALGIGVNTFDLSNSVGDIDDYITVDEVTRWI